MNRTTRALILHRPLLTFTGLYAALVIIVSLSLGAKAGTLLASLGYLLWGCAASVFFFMIILLFYFLRALKTTPLTRNWPRHFLNNFDASIAAYFTSDRLPNALISILILFPIAFFFCIVKSLIPVLHPYSLDPFLAHLDHALHFGHYPHEFLLPWIEKAGLTPAIDSFYLTWFVVLYLGIEFCIFVDQDQSRRLQFMWAYCLTWIIAGNLLAIALSSVGPIFFHEFYPSLADPYHDLMAHLQAQDKIHPLDALKIARIEHDLTQRREVISLNALSAMPSMHVAMAALLFFYFRRVNRWAGALMALYFVLILAASIYLGWHYAIDGYAAAALVALIWYACGPLVAHLHKPLPPLPCPSPSPSPSGEGRGEGLSPQDPDS